MNEISTQPVVHSPQQVATLMGDDTVVLHELRLAIATTLSPAVDMEAMMIQKVIMCQVGEAIGHELHIEDQFIDDAVAYATSKMSSRVQCNAGHNWDNLFMQLGRFDNIRKDGKKMIGDLHVYKSADMSPVYPGMAKWFMNIVSEDKKSVMCSLKFMAKGHYQYDEKGNKVYIRYSRWFGPEKVYKDKKCFVEFDSLKSCDIVDEGATTDKLFSTNTQSNQQMEKSPLEQFMQFCNKFFGNKQQPMSQVETPPAASTMQADPPAQDPPVTVETLSAQVKKMETDHATALAAKDKTILELQDQVKKLGKEPREDLTTGATGDVNLSVSDLEKALAADPINQKAMKSFGHLPRKTAASK